jgi:quercetin dioxygenase-like cupin family protein
VPGYVTLLVEATIDAGTPVARHTHPGVESAYFWKVASNFPYRVKRPWMKAGDSVQIAAETAHGGGEAGDAKTRVLVTYVVQKDKLSLLQPEVKQKAAR